MEIIASMSEADQILSYALSLGLEDTEFAKLLKMSPAPADKPATALEDLPRALPVSSKAGVAHVPIVGHLAYCPYTAELETIRNAREVHFSVNSGGGDARIALDFATALEGKHSVATIDGKACSGSLSIVQACTVRRITAGSKCMVHPLLGFFGGNVTELRHAVSQFEEIVDRHLALYARRVPVAEVRRWWDSPSDVWFSAEEALEAKLVDEIIDPFPPAAVTEGLPISTPAGHADVAIEDLLIRIICRARTLFEDKNQFRMVIDAFAEREKNGG